MAFLLEGKNEFDAYLKLVNLILEHGYKSSRYLEVLNCLLSISYTEEDFQEFVDYKDEYLETVGRLQNLHGKGRLEFIQHMRIE